MSKSKISIHDPPRSPPINIPRIKKGFNSFFPEPDRTVRLLKLNKWQASKNSADVLKQELEIYKKELDIFIHLKKGEKLGKEIVSDTIFDENKTCLEETEKTTDNNHSKYYKQKPYRGLWLTRWWYSEGRGQTVQYLDQDFTKFMNYLDRILYNLNNDTSGLFVKLVNNIGEFINSIIIGLYSLKQTYSTYVKMIAKVDSIILTLLDFKEKTEFYLTKNQQNVEFIINREPIKRLPKLQMYKDMPRNSV